MGVVAGPQVGHPLPQVGHELKHGGGETLVDEVARQAALTPTHKHKPFTAGISYPTSFKVHLHLIERYIFLFFQCIYEGVGGWGGMRCCNTATSVVGISDQFKDTNY